MKIPSICYLRIIQIFTSSQITINLYGFQRLDKENSPCMFFAYAFSVVSSNRKK